MADKRVVDLPENSSLATGDKVYNIDVSDTTDHAGGSSKWFSISTLSAYLASLAQTLSSKKHSGDFELTGATDNFKINNADPKRGIYIPASAFFPATTNGCASLAQGETTTNKVNYKYLAFDGTSDEYAWIHLPQMPDYWDLSTITVKFYWTFPSGSGNVQWGAAALCRSNDDALDTALGTSQVIVDTCLTAEDIHVTSSTPDITVGGTPAKGDSFLFRVFRYSSDSADTLNGVDAYLLGVRIIFGMGQYDDQ